MSEGATTTVAVGNYRPDVVKTWKLYIDALPSGIVNAVVPFALSMIRR